MEKEKMIEEIARIICENKIDDCLCPEPQKFACTAYNKARDILKKVLSDNTMEIYKRLCNVEYSIYDDAHGYAGALASEFEKIFNEHGMEVKE